MAQFPAPPPPLPISRRLQPELIPVTTVAGSFIVGVGAGIATAIGAGISLTIGQGFFVGAGQATAVGAPVSLSLGAVAGFNVGAGQIVAFGNTVSLGTTSGVIPPPPTPEITPFTPALSELGVDAWERVGKQTGELTVTHINSMRRSMNFVLSRWANRGINLWRVNQLSIALQPGVATYPIPGTVIDMLDTYISTTYGGIAATDIIITPMGRDTYAALPYKLEPGRPILYWFDRTITPSVTVWPVPDTTTVYTLNYFAFSQVTDADPSMGNTGNMPYRFLEAFTAAVAAHLAQKWGTAQRAVALNSYAQEVWIEASDEDREKVTLSMAPDFSDYM